MTTKGAPKGGKTPAKGGSIKTPGKDTIKSDKTATNVLDIVPGKFNETDWISLLDNDETEDYIADIFDDIWKETSKQIQQIYIRKQLVPFTVTMVEQALTNVVRWAFLERDEPKPVDGYFWTQDDEPIACTMDNWGEGVVPSCREEHVQNTEQIPVSIDERSPTLPADIQTSEETDHIPRPSSSASQSDTIPNKQFHSIDQTNQENQIETKTNNQLVSQKEIIVKRKPYNHDILVIDTQPPKLEPLTGLFHSAQGQTNNSSSDSTAALQPTKRRRFVAPKASSQLGSDAVASTTNITETTKTTKKNESKLFDDQRIEEIISKAPVAAQSMLKSILSRPPGYRELELDDHGNVISIAKLDLDKIAPRSVSIECDIIKPRRTMAENRSIPKQTQSLRVSRTEQKFASVKLVLPQHSTAIGDLIQPVPGVLYEDLKIKKGDPRRYRDGMSKYTSFIDENRPLKPIARKSNLPVLQSAHEFLCNSNDYNDENDNNRDPQIPKLHRLARIPPIISSSSTSSV